jgi:hypothetical protein
MIRELSVQEQKYQAVLAVLTDGVSVNTCARRPSASTNPPTTSICHSSP